MSFVTFISVSHLLKSEGVEGSKVKSLICTPLGEWEKHNRVNNSDEILTFEDCYDPLKKGPIDHQTIERAYYSRIRSLLQSIYEKLEGLQTLIIQSPLLVFDFLRIVDGKLVPQAFMTNSLTKLYIAFTSTLKWSLTAKNAIFLLLNCPHLERAALGFSIHVSDFQYLFDYSGIYEGLSRVKELAIHFDFVWEDKFPGSFQLMGFTKRSRSRLRR